jgi:hypothetical protein
VFMAELKRKPHAAYLTYFCHRQAEHIFTPGPRGSFLPLTFLHVISCVGACFRLCTHHACSPGKRLAMVAYRFTSA